jgi:hypothetical protein
MVVAIRLVLFDQDSAADTSSTAHHSPEWGKQRQDQTGYKGKRPGLGGGDEQDIHVVLRNCAGLPGDEQDRRSGEEHESECA